MASREEMALTALALEARRRGIGYGKLVAGTTVEEQKKIVQKYEEQAGKKKRK